eukprot:TRINITY_DN139_c1_g1_i16.p1 TRINITY_DN139_c1_g1~~TRINITY_DN139_c1_g1_i16.p1  ORF type:complete len:536 (+),score=110.54 TRINITY_DN139_c1_g1_i16:75-1610(+)
MTAPRAVVLLALAASCKAMTREEVLDFVIENKCTEPKGVLDPASPLCTKSENIAAGDPVFYLRTDRLNAQAMHSFLSQNYKGDDRIVSTMEFGNVGTTTETYQSFHEMTYNRMISGKEYWYRDGGNFMEIEGTHSSYVGTQDPNYPQRFCGSPVETPTGSQCSCTDDAWLLFPNNIVKEAPPVADINWQNIVSDSNPTPCGTGKTQTVTTSYLGPVQYLGYKKPLDTIVSSHKVGTTKAAIERQFYTKEYGHTKWEAWCKDESPNSGCEAKALTSWCSGPDTEGEWKRYDCREWTNIRSLPEEKQGIGYNLRSINFELPPHLWDAPDFLISAMGNVVINGDGGIGTMQYWSVQNNPNSNSVQVVDMPHVYNSTGEASLTDHNTVFKFTDVGGAYTFGPTSLASMRPLLWQQPSLKITFGFDVKLASSDSTTGVILNYAVDVYKNGLPTTLGTGNIQCVVGVSPNWQRCSHSYTFSLPSWQKGDTYGLALYIQKTTASGEFYVDDIFVQPVV